MAGSAFILRMRLMGVDRVDEALASDQLIIGWSNAPNLLDPALTQNDFRRIVHDVYHADEDTARKAGQAFPHLWRFMREMSPGDLVLAPQGDAIYFAEILTGAATYDASKRTEDSGYRRKVRWFNDKKPIPKTNLSPGLLAEVNSLRGTSRDVTVYYTEIAALAHKPVSEEDWTPDELDAVVADYRDMLREELAGLAYNKTEHRRALLIRVQRSEGSIEFKHQNISAVLEEIGLPWIKGYKPRHNFQASLVQVVGRLIAEGGETLPLSSEPGPREINPASVFVPAPPRSSAKPKPSLPVTRLARKIDQAGRDARNRDLGARGEEFVFALEKKRLAHLPELAAKVSWDSKEKGDGLGYDILSFDSDGTELFIEVKTTRGGIRTPFYISAPELAVAEEKGDGYRLYRVFEFGDNAQVFELRLPLEEAVELETTVYRASPR